MPQRVRMIAIYINYALVRCIVYFFTDLLRVDLLIPPMLSFQLHVDRMTAPEPLKYLAVGTLGVIRHMLCIR